jgi:glycerol dehydrogenase
MKRVINSPSKYVQGSNELSNLNIYASSLGKKGVYAIVDPFVLEHFGSKIEMGFKEDKLKLITWKFNGESSQKEIDTIVENLKKSDCDVVAGIGGGKAIDTAKAVAYYAELPVVIVPTIASSDAPCSALSVIYREDGEFERYLLLPKNPELVLVDTAIIAHAPVRLFVAGMGDALATYFEARACYLSQANTMAGGVCSTSALALARQCLDTLYEDGLKAKVAVENKTTSRAVENIIEANTYLSGIGFESGGLAAAHAIHNGLTVLEDTHEVYHGEKVSFGTIVQLVLENAPIDEIEEVIAFCKSVGLPTNLHSIGIKNINDEKVRRVAEASCAEGETIFNMPVKITVEEVMSAIYVANELGSR